MPLLAALLGVVIVICLALIVFLILGWGLIVVSMFIADLVGSVIAALWQALTWLVGIPIRFWWITLPVLAAVFTVWMYRTAHDAGPLLPKRKALSGAGRKLRH